jgi:hypothetical protein
MADTDMTTAAREVAHEEVDVRAIATRYLGAELGAWYADNNPPDDDTVVVRLRPEQWLTVDYGKTPG